jgi:hypothetical protein
MRVKKPPHCESLLKAQCFQPFPTRLKGRRNNSRGRFVLTGGSARFEVCRSRPELIAGRVARLATEIKMTSPVPTSVRAAMLVAATVGIFWFALPDRAMAEDPAAQNQDVPPPSADDGRYTFHRRGEGFVRLDSRTGQVSQCGWSAATWACKLVPDERAALESELGRLQRDNAELKKSLLTQGLELPNGMVAEAPPVPPADVPDPSAKQPKGPSEADLDRAFSFVKNVWRRLVDMMVDLQRDMQRKS